MLTPQEGPPKQQAAATYRRDYMLYQLVCIFCCTAI